MNLFFSFLSFLSIPRSAAAQWTRGACPQLSIECIFNGKTGFVGT